MNWVFRLVWGQCLKIDVDKRGCYKLIAEWVEAEGHSFKQSYEHGWRRFWKDCEHLQSCSEKLPHESESKDRISWFQLLSSIIPPSDTFSEYRGTASGSKRPDLDWKSQRVYTSSNWIMYSFVRNCRAWNLNFVNQKVLSCVGTRSSIQKKEWPEKSC